MAASIAGHVLLLAAFALSIRPQRTTGEAPAMIVSLMPWIMPRAPQKAPRAKSASAKPIPQAPRPRPAPPVITPVEPAKGLPADATRQAGQDDVRAALQALVLCGHPEEFKLDPAQRERCRGVTHHMGEDAPTYVVDPHPHARHDPPVASHGTKVIIGPASPKPGVMTNLPVGCGQTWCNTPQSGPSR